MANTTPDNIQYPVNSDQVAPLASHFKNLADSTQAALNSKVNTNDSRLTDQRTPLDNSVTSAKIANGAIVDADVNASAAIAATKIAGTAVTQADTGTITSAMIANGTIVSADIASIDGNTVPVQIRRNTEALWTSTNPTLAAGEIGFETDTGLSKIGNGSSNWVSLAYTATSTIKQAVKAGESLTRGQAVYASGTDSGYLVVSKASNATEATSSKTLGLINQDLASGATGRLVTEGLLNGVNTSTATAGDPVWLGTSGNLLYGMANKPVAPAHLVFIGIVTVANTSGTIYIRPQNGFELDELHNVLITSPADKQVLAYESATQLWKNKQATGGVTVGATAPSSPNSGDAWFDSNDGTLYVWYVDTDTSQWVQVQANSALEGTILARLGALESQAIAYGNRQSNVIINGDFSINQRAFTPITAGGVYGFDRWRQDAYNGSPIYSSQPFTPGNAIPGYEAANFARVAISGQSASGDYVNLNQSIEDVRTLAGQTATISFWAKAASGTPKVAVELVQSFGSGGSPSSNVNTYAGQVTLSTTWTRYSVTVSVPSILGKTLGTTANTSYLGLVLWTSAGSSFNSRTGSLGIQSNTFDFWGVQVEAGSVATRFHTATGTIQGELAACQRYYQQFDLSQQFNTGNALVATKWNYADAVFANLYLTTAMRVPPTMTRSINTARYVNSSGPSTPTVTFLSYTSSTTFVSLAYGNNGVGSGSGWLDNMGIHYASAEF
jgi:hypothetical protein